MAFNEANENLQVFFSRCSLSIPIQIKGTQTVSLACTHQILDSLIHIHLIPPLYSCFPFTTKDLQAHTQKEDELK